MLILKVLGIMMVLRVLFFLHEKLRPADYGGETIDRKSVSVSHSGSSSTDANELGKYRKVQENIKKCA